MSLDRRKMLALSGAASIAAALPATPAVARATKAAAPKPVWIVGTPGEPDHEIIRALTREAAIAFRAEDCDFEDDPDADASEGEGGPDCMCEACSARGGFEATRVEAWDKRRVASITSGDWVDAGFDGTCDRCGYEASLNKGGRNVQGKAICGDCMTLADWDVIDPERAAELREEQLGRSALARANKGGGDA